MLEQIWTYVESGNEKEKDLPPIPDFKEISSKKVEQAIVQINQVLKDEQVGSEEKYLSM